MHHGDVPDDVRQALVEQREDDDVQRGPLGLETEPEARVSRTAREAEAGGRPRTGASGAPRAGGVGAAVPCPTRPARPRRRGPGRPASPQQESSLSGQTPHMPGQQGVPGRRTDGCSQRRPHSQDTRRGVKGGDWWPNPSAHRPPSEDTHSRQVVQPLCQENKPRWPRAATCLCLNVTSGGQTVLPPPAANRLRPVERMTISTE